jgi:hypothetical protein
LWYGRVTEVLVAEHRYEKKLVLLHYIASAAVIINGGRTTVVLVHLEPELGDGRVGVDRDNKVVIDERDVLA